MSMGLWCISKSQGAAVEYRNATHIIVIRAWNVQIWNVVSDTQ